VKNLKLIVCGSAASWVLDITKVSIKYPEINQKKGNGGYFMTLNASRFNRFRNNFNFISKFIHKIFNYLSGCESETGNNRILLRRLYNSGYLDDGKYQDLCEKCSQDNFDPEELPM